MPKPFIIGTRIKELRRKRGFTQAYVAHSIGVSRSSVTSWELGNREPNALDVRNLCQLFSVSSDYLCGRTDSCTTINIPKVYNIDITKLNSMGKRMLFEFYEFLAQNETYTK